MAAYKGCFGSTTTDNGVLFTALAAPEVHIFMKVYDSSNRSEWERLSNQIVLVKNDYSGIYAFSFYIRTKNDTISPN